MSRTGIRNDSRMQLEMMRLKKKRFLSLSILAGVAVLVVVFFVESQLQLHGRAIADIDDHHKMEWSVKANFRNTSTDRLLSNWSSPLSTTVAPAIISLQQAREVSSVDYFACCGAGHRLSKLVDAYYLAKHLHFGLRAFFGFCDKQEVFSYLFGPQPRHELGHAATGVPGLVFRVNNDVPGFYKLLRQGPNTTCHCSKHRMESDVEFYTSLRGRFRSRHTVDQFVHDHFANHTVIGMHIRAGNGESGDFTIKNRSISDPQWTKSMARQLIQMSQTWEYEEQLPPPLLFLATDTASMIPTFQKLLRDAMPVLYLKQDRPQEGKGVLFGEALHILNKGEQCLAGWESVFMDMMLLSHVDVLVAARPSSFTQSLPMTLVLSTPLETRKVQKSFCEVNPSATSTRCYRDLMEWCCEGITSFSLQGIQKHDYKRMPRMNYLNSSQIHSKITVRPRLARECIPTPRYPIRQCLPYDMPDKDHVEEAGRMVGRLPANEIALMSRPKKVMKEQSVK